MWSQTSEERLASWHALRTSVHQQSLHSCLLTVNDWWFQCPIGSNYLRWDRAGDWPGPWDLLAGNRFCELARALGIVYTLLMLDRGDIVSIDIIRTNDNNLVQVNGGKYILNWCPGQLLNIQSDKIQAAQQIPGSIFHNRIR